MEQTLRDFERSLQKLKDCTYHEATQKQEYEKRVRAMAAELRGASLREQVRLICLLFTPVIVAVSRLQFAWCMMQNVDPHSLSTQQNGSIVHSYIQGNSLLCLRFTVLCKAPIEKRTRCVSAMHGADARPHSFQESLLSRLCNFHGQASLPQDVVLVRSSLEISQSRHILTGNITKR